MRSIQFADLPDYTRTACVRPTGYDIDPATGHMPMCGKPVTHIGVRRVDGWVSGTAWCADCVAWDLTLNNPFGTGIFEWAHIEGAPRPPMNDTTAIEATDGSVILVELAEQARVIRFLDDNDNLIRGYDFGTFASLTTGIALDAGAALVIDAHTVAQVKQWANLDAIGRNLRNM